MKAIILCAGEGTRLRPLTETMPKPMVPINDKPVLEYIIGLCRKQGINQIAINTSHFPEKIKEYFGDGTKFGVSINYSYEDKLLGTAGALNNFRDFFDDTFVVLYGDEITNIDLKEMYNFHKKNKSLATMAVRTKPRGYNFNSLVILDNDSTITKFLEKPNAEQIKQYERDVNLSNTALYIFEPEVLKFIPPGFSDFAKDIFPALISSGQNVKGFIMDKYFLKDVGTIERYESLKEEARTGKIDLNSLLKNERAIFLDRDGTINENLYEVDGKLMSPANMEQFKLIKGVKEGIKMMKEQGFKVVVISNQPGIAFGYIAKDKLEEINKFLIKEIGVDAIYYCPHHVKYTGECECRKPKSGLINKASKDLNIDVSSSYMVGDSLSDVKTGNNAGVKKTIRIGKIREDILELQHQQNIFPDFTVPDLIEAAKKIEEIEKGNV